MLLCRCTRFYTTPLEILGGAQAPPAPPRFYAPVYLEEASYVKAQNIRTVGPVAQLHVSVAGDLFCCKVRTCSTFIGITELPHSN